jgi:uncharacterized membrane protein YozB (DUF420 family)
MHSDESRRVTPVATVSPLPSTPNVRSMAVRERSIKAITWAILLLLVSIVLVFAFLRVITDMPLIISGEPAPAGSFEARYVDNPITAYLHIVLGVGYLVGALFQLSRAFREKHLRLHRRIGPFVLGAGLLSGIFALLFGVPHAFGGAGQAAATVVFGVWFLAALCLAFATIRRGDVRMHRRWMIRAFAVGVGVGSIRIWIGLLEVTGILTSPAAFVPAFWLGLGSHALVAELWLRWRPDGPPVPRMEPHNVALHLTAPALRGRRT